MPITTKSILFLYLLSKQKSKYNSNLFFSLKRNIISCEEETIMDFMTTKEAALKWGLTNRMVQYYCKEG